MGNKIKQLTILIGDIIILYAALFLALAIRYRELPFGHWNANFWPFSAIFVVWIIIFYINDLYSLHNPQKGSLFFKSSLNATVIASILSIIYFYANSGLEISPKAILLIFIVIFFSIFTFWRLSVNWLLGSFVPRSNLLFIGCNNQVRELIESISVRPNLGYNCKAIIDNDSDLDKIGITPIIKGDVKLSEVIKTYKISAIIISKNPHSSDDLRAEIFSCLNLKINIWSLPNFYERITGKVPIEAISQIWFIENLSEGSKRWFNTGKRLFDISFSLLAIAITFPLWPIVIAVIKMESKGSGFFKQKRIGENGKEFTILKFRTMRTENNDFKPTTGNDNRITKFGNFLRTTRLDELPQLINILRGEMSLVGPRPERPELIMELQKEIPFYQERMLVKPGLTGWDQVSGEYHSPSKEDTLKKLQYDLFYIKNRSLYLDLSIILKTIAIVFSRKGL